MTLQMKMDESFEEGVLQGEIKILYFRLNLSPEEIAEEMQISLEEVNNIIGQLEKV